MDKIETSETEAQPTLLETMGAAYDELSEPETETETAVETPQAAIPDPDAAPEVEASDEPTPDEPDTETETDDSQPLEAPEHWSDEHKAMFSDLQPDAQEFLLRRHRETESDYTRKTQDLAEQRKALEPLEQVLAPYRSAWSTQGVTDAQAVQRLLAAHVSMTQNPVETIQYLAQTYGADLSQLVPSETQSDYHDPEVTALKQEIEQLKGFVQQQSSQTYAASQDQILSQINSFANATDTDGNALHPHFNAVQTRMAALVNAERQLGNELTLDQAYEQAVKLDPTIEAEITTAAQKKAEEALAAEAARRAAKAKRAAATNIRSTGKAGSSAPAPTDIKDALSQSWSELGGT